MNINPIFRQPNPLITKPKTKVPEKPTQKRATRSDKCRDIKIPVTDAMRAAICRAADRRKMKETAYCTELLIKALSYPMTSIPEYPYEDTHLYMHVKPTAYPSEKVLEMKIHFKISRREAAYRLVRFMMEKEGMWP